MFAYNFKITSLNLMWPLRGWHHSKELFCIIKYHLSIYFYKLIIPYQSSMLEHSLLLEGGGRHWSHHISLSSLVVGRSNHQKIHGRMIHGYQLHILLWVADLQKYCHSCNFSSNFSSSITNTIIDEDPLLMSYNWYIQSRSSW